jgi:hypothetical protein
MRPFWAQLSRAATTMQIWQRSQHRFASNVLGPHFESICREWVLYFAGDRFGGLPAQVMAGTVNDAAGKSVCEVDVAAVGHADTGRPPLLAIGEAKWNEVMDIHHLARLRRIRDLLAGIEKYDTSHTRLICFSGAGFTSELADAASHGEVELIGLDELYGQA